MNADEIRQKFLNFFEKKGHKIVPSSSLLPTDSSVLFTTAGMQQFKPYYTGQADAEKDFGGKNVTSIQKCARTSDIEEVGDERHLTFFEMLGNFSFGGYFKKEAILFAHEFVTQEMNLKIDYVSVFGGEDEIPADEESEKIWLAIDPNLIVKKFGKSDNFWGPTGEEGPCGPTTEIYVKGIEIWNLVFNQYYQTKEKILKQLSTPGVDTGMGLERITAVVNGKDNVFETDLFAPIISEITQQSAKVDEKSQRIIADHTRTAVFMLTDGIIPSNTNQGYVLRRIIRRAIRYADLMRADAEIMKKLAYVVIEKYKKVYPELEQNREKIFAELNKEEEKFRKTLVSGLREFAKGHDPFDLYQTYGFPFELTKELAKEKGVEIDEEEFYKKLKEHQELSRTASVGMFKGGLAGAGEMETKYHTATHLLLASLRQVLKSEVVQKGSNINSERLRFDFNWTEKLTNELLKNIENLVNQKIAEKIPVELLELPKNEAQKMVNVLSFDLSKYGDVVKVYKIGDFSAEFCGGPHVTNTSELGHFKIIKEEAISAGVRRIKAVLE